MKPVRIDLLRHGQAVGGSRLRGSTDDPLTETGWERMRAAVAGHGDWDGLVTSPSLRCAAFADELARERDLPVQIEDRLREIHFGGWEGRTYAELMARNPMAVTRFFSDPLRHPPPGGEPLPDFRERVMQAWDDLLGGSRGLRPLLITHGGVIRLLLCHLRQWPMKRLLEIDVPHASLYRLSADTEGRWREENDPLGIPGAGHGPSMGTV